VEFDKVTAAQHSDKELRLMWLPRTIAVLLALGGCFWGLLLSPWLFRADVSPMAIAVFGPGYLITLGYIIRSICTPSLGLRRFIWGASLLVQGLWLACITWAMAEHQLSGQSLNDPLLPIAWWALAAVASVVALFTERAKQTESSVVPDPTN
jgi:hypothetical protein